MSIWPNNMAGPQLPSKVEYWLYRLISSERGFIDSNFVRFILGICIFYWWYIGGYVKNLPLKTFIRKSTKLLSFLE